MAQRSYNYRGIFGQAEEIQLTPTQAFKLPFKDKADSDDYVGQALAEAVTPEQLAHIKAHGAPIGTWARYRNLYKGAPVYKDGKIAIKPQMPVDFLNGESHWVPTHFSDELFDTPKPLPSHLEFRAQVTKDESKFYIIDFEPIELMEAFEKLGANGEKVYIEFDAQVPRQNMKICIYNDTKPKDEKTPKEFIELKKLFSFLCSCGAATTNKPTEPVTHFKWCSVATAPRDYYVGLVGQF